jgi:hypothetical protein
MKMQEKSKKLKKLEIPDIDKLDEKHKFIHKMCLLMNELMEREIKEFYKKNQPYEESISFQDIITLQIKILTKYCSATLAATSLSLDVPVLNVTSTFTGDILNQTAFFEDKFKDI